MTNQLTWLPSAAVDIVRLMIAFPKASVLVRTWFGDDSAWESLASEVQNPSEDGFLADVTLVNDSAFEGLSDEGLKARQTDGPIVSFIADKTTLTNAEHPILAVWVLPRSTTRICEVTLRSGCFLRSCGVWRTTSTSRIWTGKTSRDHWVSLASSEASDARTCREESTHPSPDWQSRAGDVTARRCQR